MSSSVPACRGRSVEAQKIVIPVVAGGPHTYYVSLKHKLWQGNLTALRIDLPYRTGEVATSTLSRIEVLSDIRLAGASAIPQ